MVKTMEVKVSKTIARTLQKAFQDYEVLYCELPVEGYKLFVDYNVNAHINDYDWDKQVMKYIKVLYPYEDYGNANYLTTNDLERLFHESDKTMDGFIQRVFDEIQI